MEKERNGVEVLDIKPSERREPLSGISG